MAITFFCPLGHTLTAEDHQAGTEIECSACGQRAIVPRLEVSRSGDEEKAYQVGVRWRQVVRWLAVALGLMAAFGAAPAVMRLGASPSPTWIWIVLFAATLQGLLIVWLLATPDWAALRVVMLFYLFVAAAYGLMTVAALAASRSVVLPWGLQQVRPWIPRWSASVLLVMALGAYLCAHISSKWRRAFAAEMSLKRR